MQFYHVKIWVPNPFCSISTHLACFDNITNLFVTHILFIFQVIAGNSSHAGRVCAAYAAVLDCRRQFAPEQRHCVYPNGNVSYYWLNSRSQMMK